MNMQVNLQKLLEQAQDMQSKMQSAQEELAKIVVTGEAGEASVGLVKIDMDGRHTVQSLSIDLSLLKAESKAFTEELLVSAFNNALQKIEKSSRQKLSDLTAQIQTKFSDVAKED